MRNLSWLCVIVAVLVLGSGCSVSSALKARAGGLAGSGGASSDRTIVLPDLIDMPKDQAIAALAKAGFEGTIDWDDQLCGSVIDGHIIEKGQVCRQHPPAGREQPSRLPITLLVQPEDPRHGNVGKFGEWHLMPDVVGMPLERAKAAMRAAGFTDEHTQIDEREEPGCKPSYVCRTYPDALERAGQSSDRVLFVGASPDAPPAVAAPPTDGASRDTSQPPTATPEPEPGSYF
jgi:beta-lactam-binding protein with PASTA domain